MIGLAFGFLGMPASIRLLLVEANESDRRSIRQALRGHATRFRLSIASNLQEVGERLNDGHFDAALVDVDGWSKPFDTFDHIRALRPDLPIIALSRADLAVEAARHGANGFVSKTEHDLTRLHAAVPAVLEQVADQAQRQALLRQAQSSESRYRSLFNKIQDALLVCDGDDTIRQVNSAAEGLWEQPAAALVGTPLARWLATGKSSRVRLADRVGSEPARVSLRVRDPAIPVELSAGALTLDDQPAYLVILHDLRREDRAVRLRRALTSAAAAMQGALTSQDVFHAAGEALRSVGLILSVFRLLDGGNALVMLHTELAPRVLDYTRRVTGLDPLSFRISVERAPILQSVLERDGPQIMPTAVEVIREMLPRRLKRLAGSLQKVMGYDEQLGLRLRLEGRIYGLILVGYTGSQLVPDDRSVIAAFGEQIQAALERAHRFEMTQSRLTAKLQELTRLVQVSEQMQLRLPIDRLLEMICQAIHESLGWERVILWLRDEQSLALRLAAMQGVFPSESLEATPPEEAAGPLRQSKHRISRSYFVPQPDTQRGAPTWQAGDRLLIPIDMGDRRLGLIQVDRPASGQRPTPDDVVSLELFANQAAVAIENTRYYERASERLTQRTDELSALTALSALGDQGDVRASLEQALTKVLEVSGMDAADIALLDPATGELRPYAWRGVPEALWEASRQRPIRVGEGVAGRALVTGRVIVITDVAADPRVSYRDEIQQAGIQTIVGIGLAGRYPVGSMRLFARSTRRLADETVDWLAVAGHQIALAVENTRLLEATRRRQKMAEAIREVNAAVASNLELDAVLETILDQVGRVAPYDSASILQVEPDALRIIAVRGLADSSDALGYTFPRDGRIPSWQAVLRREAQVIADVTAVETWAAGPAASQDIRAWIGAPLIVHDEVIGLLALDHHQPGFYTEEDARNASLIAQQAAVAIDNARRFQTERERSQRLRLLNEIGRELTVALDKDTILRLAVEPLARAERLGYAQVSVYLLGAAPDTLILAARAGADLREARATADGRLSINEGPMGLAASTGQTYFGGDDAVGGVSDRRNSVIAVPLRTDAERGVVGVLSVESDRPNAFSVDDVVMLETLAGQVSAALSITELYQETHQRAGNLSMLLAASQEFSSSLDSDQVLGRLAQSIVNAADATSARVHLWNVESGVSRLMAQYVGPRAGALERLSRVGAEQPLSELPGLVAAIGERQPTAYRPDSESIDRALSDTLRAHSVTSALYLPLLAHEQLIGCVEVWDTSRERARAWLPDEIHLCQTIANVAAGAIDNARLFEVERRRRAVAETLRELAAVVSSMLELQPILEALLDRAAELIPYDSAAVFILSPASNAETLDSGLRVAVSRGLPQVFDTDWFRLSTGSLAEEVIRRREVVIHSDVRDVANWVRLPGTEYMRGWLGAPLIVKGRALGALTFDSRTAGRYRREHGDIGETIAFHTAMAIENARLYQETRQRLLVLETLRVVSLEMIQSLDLQRVAQAIADGALRLLAATAVHLFSFDAEANVLQMVAKSAAPGYEAVGQPTPRREGLTMQVAHHGQAVVINDPYNDPEYATTIQAWPGTVRAMASLPLHVRDRVLGVMNVIFHISHTIDDNDVGVLGLLADQAATALENARLFADEQKRRVAADVLREISAVLTSTLNLSEVFERLFDQIARVIPYTSAAVLQLDGSNHLQIIAGRGFHYPDRVIGVTIDLTDETPSWQVIQTRRPLAVDDVQALAGWQMLPGQEETRGWMGAPLVARDEVIGALSVDHTQPGVYRQEQAELFGVIANQAAAAISNARLYEQALERERFASALGRVSLAITSTLELNAVLDQICRESAEAFNVDSGLVWLAEGEELVGFAGYGVGREAFLGARTRLDDPVTLGARVLYQRRSEFVNQATSSDRINQPLLGKLGLQSLLAAPMLKGDTPIGTLVIGDSTNADRFTAADIDRAKVLATHAAIAIENARLFQAEQHRARELALVNRVGLEITSILDLDQLAQRVVEAIHTAFGYYHVAVVTIDGGMMLWRAGAGSDVPGWNPAGLQRPVGLGIVGAAASGEMVLARDVRRDPRYMTTPETQRALSEVALPLRAKGIVIGVLDVLGDRVDAFGDEDLNLLQALASQLSVAVENALLYQALAKYAASLEMRVAERTAEIRREQERTFAILNSVADAVLVTDMAGLIVLANPVAEAALWEDDQGKGAGRLRAWLHDLTPDSGSPKIKVGDRTLQAAIAYIREDEHTVGHVIVLRDITRLEEVDRLKTQFVSNVSHELRTPLTNIKLYVGLFQKGKPERREQYLATLDSEVNRLEVLITNLLDLSRLERERGPVVRETIELVDVLRHVTLTLAPQAEAKRQTLQLSLQQPSLRLPADQDQMIQVFVNLVANAINYTPPEGSISLSASTAERDGQSWAIVAVTDNGVGIPPGDLNRIFDRFYRGQAEKYDVRGTGLGLAIVKEIVEQHAGEVTVDSQVHQGSTFTVWLPMS